MTSATQPTSLPTTPVEPAGVQPGGGFCMSVEETWGRLRRGFLRMFRRSYVERMQAKRQGSCPDCQHDIIDSRDLKYRRNVCGYWFRPEDDLFCWHDHLGLARHGLAEVILFSLLFASLSIGAGFLGELVHWACWLLLVPLGLLWLEIIYFFRDPQRTIPTEPNALVSPADGKVTNIEEVDEPDFPGRALRISIFLSIFNVHVNRLPRSGRVTQVRYFPGAFLDARNPESAVRNEQLWIDLEDAQTGRPLRVKQISGAIARRIVCWLKKGDEVVRGERLGMIKLGSRTDILIPVGLAQELLVKVGDTVKGGATTLLRLG